MGAASRAAASPRWGVQAGASWQPRSDFTVVLAGGAIAAALILGMAAKAGPLTTLAGLAALVAAIVAPSVGLALLAFTATLQPPPGFPAPGFASFLVGATLLGCVYRLPIDRPRIRASAPLVLLCAFVLYVTVQQLPEMVSGYAGQEARAVGYLFFQVVTGFGLVVAAVWVLAGRSPFPFIAMGLAGAVTAATIAVMPYLAPGIAGPFLGLAAYSDDLTRASGAFGNPNFMGGSAAIATAAAAGLLTGERSRPVQVFLIGAIILLGAAVALSLSRGAVVATVAGLAWLAISRSRASAVLAIVVGLVGAMLVYPAFVEWRLVSLTGSASVAAFESMAISDAGRLIGVLASVPLFLSSPIVGVGFGHYLASSIEITGTAVGAHNWYGYVLAELGMVGIVLWLMALVALVITLRRRSWAAQRVGFAVLSSFGVACLFLEVPTSFQTAALPSLVLAAAAAGEWPRPREPEDGGASRMYQGLGTTT